MKGKSIGRQNEQRTKKLLENEGWITIGTGISTKGVDFIAFKFKKIALVESKTISKTTNTNDIVKQFQLYKELKQQLAEKCFDVDIIYILWFKLKRWHYIKLENPTDNMLIETIEYIKQQVKQ